LAETLIVAGGRYLLLVTGAVIDTTGAALAAWTDQANTVNATIDKRLNTCFPLRCR
jgi:hypothetical protein